MGKEHLVRVALVDAEDACWRRRSGIASTRALDGRDGFVVGAGGRVHASGPTWSRATRRRCIERLIEEERRAGALAAALFSEIGPSFYERLGFAPMPLDEVTVNVTLKGGSPAMLVRAGDDRDLADVAAMDAGALARMHDLRCAVTPRSFTIRSPRSGCRQGSGLRAQRQVEFFVAEEGASAVAYVLLSVSTQGWTLEDAGDRDPAGARLGAMLQVLAAREPSRQLPLIRAWWPRSFPVPPQWRLTRSRSIRAIC